MPVTVIDTTNRPGETAKVWIIRDSGTYLGLLSFDFALEAYDAARRYGRPLEVRNAAPVHLEEVV